MISLKMHNELQYQLRISKICFVLKHSILIKLLCLTTRAKIILKDIIVIIIFFGLINLCLTWQAQTTSHVE
jgi:uncharacterized membrane protein YhhN